MIGLLIDFGEIKGRDVNIDAEHLAQITDPGVVTS
jgi:hypothetical protein